jgi:20S proteasome alpha/beta subunit
VTLLVGISCADGVVIASDRQATHGVAGMPPTVGQAIVKPQIILGQAIYACSGPVSIGQQIAAKATELQPQFGSMTCAAAVQKLQGKFREVLNPAFETAAQAAKVRGQQIAMQEVLSQGMLAAKFQDGIQLLDISAQGACEVMLADKLSFVCAGSGKSNADPILGFLWSVYWRKQRPTLREATLAAYWTVRIGIDLKTMMVGDGPDVFVLEKHGTGGKHVRAHQLDDARLAEHDEFISAVMEQMRGVRDRMLLGPVAPAPATAPTAPPEPPPAKTG